MKIIGLMKNAYRHFKYRHEKRDEEDVVNLVDSDSTGKEEYFLILTRFLRRFSFACLIRCILLILLSIYVLMIFTPMKNLRSFIPMEIDRSEKFLVVVAHPDDECLFFSPTILGLISRGKQAHLLVFSTGNSESLGPIREKELNQSCQQLQIDLSRCLCLNLTGLQDNPHQWWPKENISSIVHQYVHKNQIDLLITFDRRGISGHVNHKSLAIGIEYYLQNIHSEKLLTYQLSTVSFLFEFSSLFNIFPMMIEFFPRLLRSLFSTLLPFLLSSPNAEQVLFVSSPLGYWKGLKAFHSHRSQMLWYRHLYTTFSRHMFINHLRQVSSNGVPLRK